MRLPSALVRQKQWDGAAKLNFQLGGAASGFYFLTWVLSNFGEEAFPIPCWVKLAGPGIVSLGLLGVALESRSPLAIIGSLRNQGASWISREALIGAIFIIFAVYDAIFPHRLASAGSALFSILFAIAQGFVLFGARGILAWNTRLLPFMFTGFSLLKGSALIMLLMSKNLIRPDLFINRMNFVLMSMGLFLWVLYLVKRSSEFRRAIKALYRPVNLVLTICFTFVIPGILLFLVLNSSNLHKVFAISGILVMIGATAMISGILKSGYYRPIFAGKPRNNILQGEKPNGSESPVCRIIPIEAGRKKISIK